MSFELPSRRANSHTAPTWAGMALIVETMVLLLFLVASLAIVTGVFASSVVRAREGEDLARAVAAATTVAERFASDPASVPEASTESGLVVRCARTSEQTGAGTLYRATLTVLSPDTSTELYALETARYVREVG